MLQRDCRNEGFLSQIWTENESERRGGGERLQRFASPLTNKEHLEQTTPGREREENIHEHEKLVINEGINTLFVTCESIRHE